MMPPRSITARYNRSLRYARVQKQRCLNLPRLNPKTADLNLMVRSTHKLQNPVRTPPRQIPAAVHPCPRSTKPVRNKALPAQPSTTQIPTRYPAPRYVKLPNNPNPNRLQTIVQDINPRVPYRTTNRRGSCLIVIENHDRRPDRSFCRAIEIGDLTPEPPQDKREPVREHLAANEHLKMLVPFGAARRERIPQSWGALENRSASLLDRSRKRRRMLDYLPLSNDNTGAADEGKKQFESRNVEANRRDRHEPIISVKGYLLSHGQKQVVHAAVRDGDAFGSSGGAGGIDDVGEVVRVERRLRCAHRLRRNRPRLAIKLNHPRARR